MMEIQRIRVILRYAIVLLTSFTLFACEIAPEPPQQPKEAKKVRPRPPKPPVCNFDTYLKQLTLAKLTITNTPGNPQSVKPHLAIISDFSASRQESPTYQPVIVITYKIKNKKDAQQAVVPFVISKGDFTDLPEVMALLNNKKFILQDIHPFILTHPPAVNITLPEDNLTETQALIGMQLDRLLEDKALLAPINEAGVQIHLLQYFIDQHMRDAAYITAENAKRSLAAADDNASPEAVTSLSNQLDILNKKLLEEMPFTLKAL